MSIITYKCYYVIIVFSLHRIQASLNNEMLPADFDLKIKICDLLEREKVADFRARTMDIDDFIRVLHMFNVEGLHFA